MTFSTSYKPGTPRFTGAQRPSQLPATEETDQGLLALLKNPPELIAQHPKVALAIALGVGVMLGCLIKRR